MAKFNDKAQKRKDVVEYLYDKRYDLHEKMQEWREKYPTQDLILEFDKGYEGCGCGCSESPSLTVYAEWTESPQDIEDRRKAWEEWEKRNREYKEAEYKKWKKIREEEDLKTYKRLQKKFSKGISK